MKPALLSIVACAVLAAGGCGGDESSSADSGESSLASTGSTESTAASTVPAPAGPLVARKPEPDIDLPKAPPPKQDVIVRDLKKGDGAVAKTGDMLTVDFLGVYYETGKLVGSSWERGEPFTFRLGGGQAILGWEKVLQGMRVGGRRELILPARLISRYLAPSERRSQIYVVDLRRVDKQVRGAAQ